jgi:hypothetical protein
MNRRDFMKYTVAAAALVIVPLPKTLTMWDVIDAHGWDCGPKEQCWVNTNRCSWKLTHRYSPDFIHLYDEADGTYTLNWGRCEERLISRHPSGGSVTECHNYKRDTVRTPEELDQAFTKMMNIIFPPGSQTMRNDVYGYTRVAWDEIVARAARNK